MNTLTNDQINAMMKSEIRAALEVSEQSMLDTKTMARMSHKQLVQALIEAQPKPEPEVTVTTDTITIRKASRKEPKPCGCGCKDGDGNPCMTKGGTFLPGHDAKYYASITVSKHAPKECRCGCGGMTKGGFYRPGHDAKHFSTLLKVSRGLESAAQVSNPAHTPQGRLLRIA